MDSFGNLLRYSYGTAAVGGVGFSGTVFNSDLSSAETEPYTFKREQMAAPLPLA
jgi:hypothetical protein